MQQGTRDHWILQFAWLFNWMEPVVTTVNTRLDMDRIMLCLTKGQERAAFIAHAEAIAERVHLHIAQRRVSVGPDRLYTDILDIFKEISQFFAGTAPKDPRREQLYNERIDLLRQRSNIKNNREWTDAALQDIQAQLKTVDGQCKKLAEAQADAHRQTQVELLFEAEKNNRPFEAQRCIRTIAGKSRGPRKRKFNLAPLLPTISTGTPRTTARGWVGRRTKGISH
jgi:hypothetical protein